MMVAAVVRATAIVTALQVKVVVKAHQLKKWVKMCQRKFQELVEPLFKLHIDSRRLLMLRVMMTNMGNNMKVMRTMKTGWTSERIAKVMTMVIKLVLMTTTVSMMIINMIMENKEFTTLKVAWECSIVSTLTWVVCYPLTAIKRCRIDLLLWRKRLLFRTRLLTMSRVYFT